MRLISGFLFLLIISMIFSTCKHDPIVPDSSEDQKKPEDTTQNDGCDPDSIYFSEIEILFKNTCATPNCHDATSAQDGVILDSYQNIVEDDNIIPGNPMASDIYIAITEDDPEDLMPLQSVGGVGNMLDPAIIDKIYKWIEQGAKNNSCETGCDTSNITFSNDIFPLIQNSCLGCHGQNNRPGAPQFTDYDKIKSRIDAIEREVLIEMTMPQGGSLDDCNQAKLKNWIDNGAQNN